MIVAVDGPAAAGKGTLARRLASHYGLAHLDTGLLYRAVGLRLLRDRGDAGAEAAVVARLTPSDLDDPELRTEAAAEAASRAAARPAVRAALFGYQRDFAARPPGGARGVVVDGRDIGTVVLPYADVKLFVTASEEVRAHRRRAERTRAGAPVSIDGVRQAIRVRDRRDTERTAAPLRPAPDAFLLDTGELDIDGVFAAAKAYISGSEQEIRTRSGDGA